MNKAIKKKWLKALRSGEYTQGTHAMCRASNEGASYCCLGVLVEEVKGEDVWAPKPIVFAEYQDTRLLYQGNTGTPRNEFLEECGLDSIGELVQMNDTGDSFKKIATWIEKNL